ncbi:MAG TPA: hypothetical protein VFJ24_08565 [Gaiellales bacterium]|nr:hypothetical protein [Gaiellales bacterium]
MNLSRRAVLFGTFAWCASRKTAEAGGHHVAFTFFQGHGAGESSRGMRLGLVEAERVAQLLGATIEVMDPAARTRAAVWIGMSHDLPMTPSRIPSIVVDDGDSEGGAPRFRVMASLARRLVRIGSWLKATHADRWTVCASTPGQRAAAISALRRIPGVELVHQPNRAHAVLVLDREAASAARPDPDAWIVAGSGEAAAFESHRCVWAEEWHPSLKRYGALELNERYRRAYDEPMSPAAWAGWFGVKCAAEAAFRGSPAHLAQSLRSARVDGHKGVALRFLPDGTLEQPLYLVGRSTRAGEMELLDQGEP